MRTCMYVLNIHVPLYVKCQGRQPFVLLLHFWASCIEFMFLLIFAIKPQ